MRMTVRKKEILSYFEPKQQEWVTSEIGPPPLDVSGITYLLHGLESFDKRYQLESTRRTLESMVSDGLLERINIYEERRSEYDHIVHATVIRYGLPGRCKLMRDTDGADDSIPSQCVRIGGNVLIGR